MPLIITGFFGASSIIMGAYASHGLQAHISSYDFSLLQTALNYQHTHSLVLLALALGFLVSDKLKGDKLLKASFISFALGIALFSFSLYASVLFNLDSLRKITPFGGSVLIISWLLLMAKGIKEVKCKN